MPFKWNLSQSCIESRCLELISQFIKWAFRFSSLWAISFNLFKWIMFYLQWSSLSKNLFQKLVSRGFWSRAENRCEGDVMIEGQKLAQIPLRELAGSFIVHNSCTPWGLPRADLDWSTEIFSGEERSGTLDQLCLLLLALVWGDFNHFVLLSIVRTLYFCVRIPREKGVRLTSLIALTILPVWSLLKIGRIGYLYVLLTCLDPQHGWMHQGDWLNLALPT